MNPSLDEINSALEQKNKKQSSIKISVKLKKLELASKLALSKGKKTKIQGQAVELLKEVDTKIKSLALQKFVVRKVKRLQALGEKRDRVNELISAMHQSRATIFDSTIVDDAKRAVLGFGIDKKFIGLSAEEVLDKVNAVRKNNSTRSGRANTSTKGSTKPTASVSSNKKNANNTNNSNGAQVKLSPNTDVVSNVKQNNEKIYDYLVQSGEFDIADYVLDLMTAPQKNDEDPKKLSEVQKNTEEIKKLSVVNSGIREELEEIKENMLDEQDTSIDLPKKLQQKKEEEAKGTPKKEDKKQGGSFLDSIMAFIGGTALSWFWKLLRGAKGVVEFAGTIIRSGWKVVSGLLGKLFSSKFALAFATAFKGAFDSAYKVSSRAALATIEFLKTGFSKLVDLVRKIPGIGKLIPESWGSGSKKTPKPGGPVKTSDKPSPKSGDKPSKLSDSKLGRASDDLAKKASKEAAKDTVAKKGAKILPKLLKFAKPIPLIGAAITAGTAIYAAYDGYENAAEITGKRTPTTEQRYIAAAASVVDDVSFGMLSSKTAAAKIMEWVSSEEVKETRAKYEAMGIITYNRVGDSSVNNWAELRRLSAEEIQKIIDTDDWSNKDLAELKKALEESRARALTKQSVQDQQRAQRPAPVAIPEKAPAPEVPTPTATAAASQTPPAPKKTSQEPVPAKGAKSAKISESAGKAAMVQALDKAKIYDPVARAAIMAQVATESGGFRVLSENLNYRAGTLTKLWPRRFPAGDAQEVAAGGPVRVAERVYSSRMGNGPEGSGDAWNYRGRGFIQLTGKNNYQRFGYASDPEALTTPETAAESALKYMGGFRGDWGNIAAVSKYVNGGKIGLEERIKWFEAMKADPDVTAPSNPEKTQSSSNTDVPKIPSGAGTTPSTTPSASSSASSSTKPAPITGDTSSQVAATAPSATPTKSDNVYKLSAVMKAQPGVDLNINKGFEERVAAMAAAFKEQTGKTLTATSGLRSNEKQKALWDAKLAETGSVAATRKWVAEPAPPLGNGRGSAHMSGVALDINSKGPEGINKLAGKATAPTGWLEKFGLTRPVKNEDWHVQPSDAKLATPDNPNKPGEPIAVPDKAGKAFDVATGKNDPSISASPQGPAAGTSTPEKSQLDMAMLDSAFIKQAKMETDTRTMQTGMASLAKEYAKASGSGNREKMENIRQAIHAKQSEFRGTQSPAQEATVADKSILAKDKAIQATEQTYSAALANTQSYDMRTSGASGAGNTSQSMTINNVNNQQKDEKTNPFEMFDNLQEA